MSHIKIFLLLSFLTHEIYSTDYCDIKCANGKIHTLCNGCEMQEPCRSYTEQQPLTIEEKRYILHVHNELRNKVALGNQEGQPKASNMKALSWNDEIANVASCWANSCKFEHDCADFPDKYPVGQNLAMKGMSGSGVENYIKGRKVLRDMIEDWYNEVTEYNYMYTNHFKSTIAGHYTQLIWAETEMIGCEKIFFEEYGFLKVYLICNYAPAGNVITQPLYNTNEPCSECECSDKYPGLCHNPKMFAYEGSGPNNNLSNIIHIDSESNTKSQSSTSQLNIILIFSIIIIGILNNDNSNKDLF